MAAVLHFGLLSRAPKLPTTCTPSNLTCLLLSPTAVAQNVAIVAASSAAAHEAAFFGVPQTTLQEAGDKVRN